MNSYIAGKIGDIPNQNIEAFKKFQSLLFVHGIIATTPHEVCEGKGCVDYNDYMAECVRYLLHKDTTDVYFMKGWEYSDGAKAEHALCLIYNKTIHYEYEFQI